MKQLDLNFPKTKYYSSNPDNHNSLSIFPTVGSLM